MSVPVASPRPYRHDTHGDVRLDVYHWLRDRANPEVVAYLEAENAYVDECLGHTAELQQKLFEEMTGRIKPKDASVPFRQGTHRYYDRYEAGQEYRVHCRTPVGGGPETVVLDVNGLAEGQTYCDVSALGVSPDERLLAFAVDTVGRRQYEIRVRNIETGVMLADVIPGAAGDFAWANDSHTLFYTRQHPTTLRSHRVCRHRLGADVLTDTLVYEEPDEGFDCDVRRSRSTRYILIGIHQTLTTEYRYVDADHPDSPPVVFLRREPGHEYHVDHFRDHFYVRSNADAVNFRVLEVPCAGSEDSHVAMRRGGTEHWREIVPHRDDVLIETFELFRDHLVLQERLDGLVRLRIVPWNGDAERAVAFPDPTYEAHIDGGNREADTTMLRFGYSSLGTPSSSYDYDMATGTRTLLKREEVLGGFDPERYRTERLTATASDGARIPISLVSRRDIERNGSSPLLLYGYGSYGISMEAGFQSSRVSLLDRGFVYAIAHIRGGQELGRAWYEDGKLHKKRNTFTDFIACAEHLVAEQRTTPKRLFAMGGSAGGLLMGAVMNMRPDLFQGVVAQVPFVDVLTTMLDETLPLTTGEYDEWGDPRDPETYHYIKSYSPYDNVRPGVYPHLLVMTGFHDSQVQYWEAAKWVAKLRALATGDRWILLKTAMDAGHRGVSGRFRRYREIALQYAFLLELADGSTRA